MTAATTRPRPPAHLSREARAWWRSIADTWDLEPHHRALLDQAATALDRAREAREVIGRDGAVTMDRFKQARAHPAARVEAAAWAEVRHCIAAMRLDESAPGVLPSAFARGRS
jgi:P27 family predicted phage terminase small subunit